MDIIKFALKMEMDGKMFYEKQAANETNPELKKILLTLAEEEQRHYEIFKRWQDDPSDVSGGNILDGAKTLAMVKNIFQTMADQPDQPPFGDDVISAWTEALRIEEKSEKFYKEKAAEESNPARKDMLQRIAAEEYNHVKMIDGVLMFLKQPADFARSAQFMNFRSLEGL